MTRASPTPGAFTRECRHEAEGCGTNEKMQDEQGWSRALRIVPSKCRWNITRIAAVLHTLFPVCLLTMRRRQTDGRFRMRHQGQGKVTSFSSGFMSIEKIRPSYHGILTL